MKLFPLLIVKVLPILTNHFLVFQNVTPAHLPDIVIYLDAIAIIFEETSKGGLPLSLPIASIETGNDHSLQNLSLRFV